VLWKDSFCGSSRFLFAISSPGQTAELTCLRLLLDIADGRLRLKYPEAELLLLRHEERVLRRQINRPHVRLSDWALQQAEVVMFQAQVEEDNVPSRPRR
jgi:hypothetical protein